MLEPPPDCLSKPLFGLEDINLFLRQSVWEVGFSVTEFKRDLFEQKKWHYGKMFALVSLIRCAHRELQMFAVLLIFHPG